jgi:hypothetical protein
MKRQLYFVNIAATGFTGWNSVQACSLGEAEKLLLKKLGEKTYKEIIWSSLKIGKEAELEDSRMEKMWAGAFD